MRVTGDPIPANNGGFYLLGDHLGSTNIIANENGVEIAELRYREASRSDRRERRDKAGGELRYPASPPVITDYRFTGQREEAGIGLYYYNARWYDPVLGWFAQAEEPALSGGPRSAGGPKSKGSYRVEGRWRGIGIRMWRTTRSGTLTQVATEYARKESAGGKTGTSSGGSSQVTVCT